MQQNQMIFFCEDCAEKNLLSQSHLKNGKATFRCSHCSYMNSYKIKPVDNNKDREYKGLEYVGEILNSLSRFPEIIGSFIFHKKKGVLANNMPASLKQTDLYFIAQILVKNYYYGLSQYPDVNEMVLVISNKNMMVKMINHNLAIIVVCKAFPLSREITYQMKRLETFDWS
jgi:DNA-directed RNA polymerase subunit RPC12/RpoP